jgi:hypothetical protein
MTSENQETLMPVVRISTGRFDPARADEVSSALRASEAALRPAIGALPGLLAYYVGIDGDTSTITNTSIWESRPEAMAMGTLQEMRNLRDTFEQLGVVFQPVATYDTLWEM